MSVVGHSHSPKQGDDEMSFDEAYRQDPQIRCIEDLWQSDQPDKGRPGMKRLAARW